MAQHKNHKHQSSMSNPIKGLFKLGTSTKRTPLHDVIKLVKDGKFKAKCRSCGKTMDLAKATLFPKQELPPKAADLLVHKESGLKEQMQFVRQTNEKILERQEHGARSVNRGLILEKMLPLLKGFRFDKNDCRSVFDPIDYIIFDGLNKTGKVKKIYFAEVKTGNAKVSPRQSIIAKRISEKKVKFIQY